MNAKNLFLSAGVVLLCGGISFAGAPPRIEMEVLVRPGINAATATQKWSKALGDMGLKNVQFRPGTEGEQIGLQGRGGGTGAIQITAELDEHGALVTPGGTFAISDSGRLKKWLGDLQAGGVETAGQPKVFFGFTHEQLNKARQMLGAPVGFSTKGLAAPKAIEQIAGGLNVKLTIDPAMEHALAGDDAVRDELQGVASGTALAAIARPAGVAVIPKYVDGKLELHLTAAQDGVESWPVGWTPGEKDEGKIVPALFDFINVEIDNTPAAEALGAIQGRLKTPFLYDYNSMARQRIDLAKKVKVPAGKTFYKKILDRVLFQARLKGELRLDDGGKPVLWVTTLGQGQN